MRTLRSKKWYRPREIAKLGLIQNSRSNNEDSNYNFILTLIKSGKLQAKDYGVGQVPHYLVSEDEIDRYHNGEPINSK